MSVYSGGAYQATYAAPAGITGATLTVTDPTGAITAPAVSSSTVMNADVFTAYVPALAVGNYLLVWSGTSAVPGLTDVQHDQFTCVQPVLDLVAFGEAKSFLNINPIDSSKDGKIRDWLRAATDIATLICGPILPTTRTDVFDGGSEFIVLPFRWVISITDIHETRGTTNYTLTEQPMGTQNPNGFGYTWDRNTNRIVRRSAGSTSMAFAPGTDVVSVTAIYGMQAVPQGIQEGVKAYLKHRFAQSELTSMSPFAPTAEDETGMVSVGNYLVPYAVVEEFNRFAAVQGFGDMGTATPAAIDYLVDKLELIVQAVNPTAVVMDGRPASNQSSTCWIAVGVRSDWSSDIGAGNNAIIEIGAGKITETIEIPFFVYAEAPGPKAKPARDLAFALWDALMSFIANDRSLGGIIDQGRIAQVSDMQAVQLVKDVSGTAMAYIAIDGTIRFDHHYRP